MARLKSTIERIEGARGRRRGWWVGVVWLALWGVAGCQAGIGEPCETDADCGSREICAQDQCTRRCDGDADCPAERGFTCQPYVPPDSTDPVNVCLPESATDAGSDLESTTCQTDSECQRRLDSGRARCGLDGQCLLAPLRVGARITDRTSEPLPQDGAPGADIAGVFLIKPGSEQDGLQSGEILGVGRSVRYRPAGEVSEGSHLDGEVPEFRNGGRCTAARSASDVTELGGDSGWMLVEFQRPDGGDMVEGFAELDIVVVEWDDNCGSEVETSDTYDIELCVTSRSRWSPDSDCRTPLGEGSFSGYTRLSIPEDGRE